MNADHATSRRRDWSATLLVSLLLLPGSAGAASPPYQDGDYIDISGTVSDLNGQPIPGIEIVLTAQHRAFSLTKFQRSTRDEVRHSTTSDAQGQFSFRWRWLEYYNRLEITAGVPRRAAAGESFEILASQDLSKRIKKGSPVVVPLTVTDSDFVEDLRDFLASIDSEDEKRIYDEMGNPDRRQTVEYPTHLETSWWYFRAGKAYRFRDGRLLQVVHFDPITPFGT